VSHWFQTKYSIEHETKTTWDNAAASVSCAELCLEDEREHGWDGRPNVGMHEHNPIIREITLAAAKNGRVNILKWTSSKAFDFHASRALVDGLRMYKPSPFLGRTERPHSCTGVGSLKQSTCVP
jgi:hypothetical protein